jgi:hypothetical protein
MITLKAYLQDSDSIEVTLIHITTNEEHFFDYLLARVQCEMPYQPGKSKMGKFAVNSAALPVNKRSHLGILPSDWLNFEMRFKEYGFIAEHFTLVAPISYLIINLDEIST